MRSKVVMQYLVIHHQQSHRPRKFSKEVSALTYVQLEKGIDPFGSISDRRFATLGAKACFSTAGPEQSYHHVSWQMIRQHNGRLVMGKHTAVATKFSCNRFGLNESAPPSTLPRLSFSRGPPFIVGEGKLRVTPESLSAAPIVSFVTCSAEGVVIHRYSLSWTRPRF